jgi:hypothetical protein
MEALQEGISLMISLCERSIGGQQGIKTFMNIVELATNVKEKVTY